MVLQWDMQLGAELQQQAVELWNQSSVSPSHEQLMAMGIVFL